MNLMKILLVLVFVAVSSISSYSQSDFRPGYVLTSKTDTLYGLIDYRSDKLMCIECRFKADSNSKLVKYGPNEIFGYRFLDSKFYVSKVQNGIPLFYEYLLKGEVNVFYRRDNKGEDHYYLAKDTGALTDLGYFEEFRQINGKKYLFQSKKHLGIMKYYFKDAERIAMKVDGINEPNHTSLIKIAEQYHNAVCKDGECIIYKKDEPRIGVGIQLTGGISKYSIPSNHDNLNFGGVGVDLWLPRTSERLFFHTGFELVGTDYIRYPVQFKYKVPENKSGIRPEFSYGVNLWNIRSGKARKARFVGQSVATSVGLTIAIKQNTALYMGYTADFTHYDEVGFIPKEFFAHNFSVGVRFEL